MRLRSGLDAMWQLVGFYLGWLGGEGKGRALGVGEVKFTGQVLPTAKVTYRIHFKRIVNRRLIMGTADGEVLVDGRLIYTANDLKVGLFGTLPRSDIALSDPERRNLRSAEVSLKRRYQAISALSPMASRQPPAIVTFDLSSDKDTFLSNVQRCRPDNHVDEPVPGDLVSVSSCLVSSFFCLVERKQCPRQMRRHR